MNNLLARAALVWEPAVAVAVVVAVAFEVAVAVKSR
jgi:hypothetical protein